MFEDPAQTAIMILVFAAVFTAVQAISGIVSRASSKRKVNQRLKVQEKTGSLAELVTELRKQRGLNADGTQNTALAWFSDLVTRSGVSFQPQRWALFAAGGAAAFWFVLFFLTKNWWLGLVLAPVAAVVGPIVVLNFLANKRAKQLGEQLPGALEIIVRSLEAGHPVPTAVALVGREMPDPVGTEFGMAGDEIAFGATLEQAVARIADRCRHPDVDLFAATIRLQERCGGNLTGLLKMNAKAIRERHKMRLKIKAASSEGRASAIILTSAPFAVLALLSVMSPKFYGDVIDQRPVQIGLACLGVWMFIGNLVMRRMIDMRI
ncbi:MAG TPA: type II secretion system F family protein [Caulobacteraceae bacterium]|nr:type II secretion system F family protein [Caulobacteraceae bacterium]